MAPYQPAPNLINSRLLSFLRFRLHHRLLLPFLYVNCFHLLIRYLLILLDLNFFLNIEEEGASSVNLIYLIVINAEISEENLILLTRVSVFEDFLHLLVGHALPHQAPKDSVVQIVDMAVHLPPPEVILHRLLVRVHHDPTVKSRHLPQRALEELPPHEDIGCSEGRY